MQNEKQGNKQKILIAIIIILVLLIIAFVVNFFVIKKKYYSDGEFKKVDGIDTYFEKGSLVKDSLVSYKGKKYYVDNEGHKKKNVMEIIDNDNHYGYFGSLGELVTDSLKEIDKKYYYFDKDGKLVTNDFVKLEDATYYASEDGSLLYRTFKILDKDYYFGRSGKLVVKEGWVRNRKDEDKRGLPSGMYYLDENGQRVKDKWLNEVYVDKTGKMAVDTWVGEYYVGKDGKYLYDTTTPDGVTLGSDGKPIEGQTVPTTTKAVVSQTQQNNQQTINQTTVQQTVVSQTVSNYSTNAPTSAVVTQETTTAQETSSMTTNSALPSTEDLIKAGLQQEQESAQAVASTVPGGGANVEQNGPTAVYQVVKGYAEGKNVEDDDDDTWYDDDEDDEEEEDDEDSSEVESEIKISSTQKISDSYDDDDYECTITLLQPIVKGGKSGEADTINGCIEEIMEELFEEVDTIINGYDDLPKSIVFSSATITSSSSSRLVITLSGKLTPRSGTSKTVKYKITYDRNEEEATLSKA